MKIIVIGGGAREHAICSAVFRSKNTQLFSVMSNCNPGIEKLCQDYMISSEKNIESIVEYAQKQEIDIALIGPEAPLELGIVDEFNHHGISACAPTKEAARIETDKEWMRQLLSKYAIDGQLPYKTFKQTDKAVDYIEELHGNVAIKPIGLTGGKGVKVAGDHFTDIQEARLYIDEVLTQKIGGQSKVLIEEKAIGEEFTIQAFSDGSTIVPLPAVQDHKRLLPDDKGPNTGGMGSYSAADGLLPFLSKKHYTEATNILQNIIDGLAAEHHPYIGPIYGQFMLTTKGSKIIEINARFGDPEAMNVLPILQTDYAHICTQMIQQSLAGTKLTLSPKATVCKYIVPEGYGIQSKINEKIFIDMETIKNSDAQLFYAAVNKGDGFVTTTSSRSLAVVGIADTIFEAETHCEQALQGIHGDHIFIRHDIGTKSLIDKRMEHMKTICDL